MAGGLRLTVAVALDCFRRKSSKDLMMCREGSCISGGYHVCTACSPEPCTLPMVGPSICLTAAFAGLCCTQQDNTPCFLDYGGTLGLSGGLLQKVPRQERGCSITLHPRSVFSHVLRRDTCLWAYCPSTAVERNPLWVV